MHYACSAAESTGAAAEAVGTAAGAAADAAWELPDSDQQAEQQQASVRPMGQAQKREQLQEQQHGRRQHKKEEHMQQQQQNQEQQGDNRQIELSRGGGRGPAGTTERLQRKQEDADKETGGSLRTLVDVNSHVDLWGELLKPELTLHVLNGKLRVNDEVRCVRAGVQGG